MVRIRRALPLGAVALLVLVGCTAMAPPDPAVWPTSMVVLGHSGATGWNSDPERPEQDAPDNSWATGTNPDVESIYTRALAGNPALEGHNVNVAESGSDVQDLGSQVERALAVDPLPDLFLIQSVDNDIRCDGTDAENSVAYGAAVAGVLARINAQAPDARIYVVGLWATVQNFSDVTATIPAAVRANHAGGVCDVFDAAGQEIPSAIAAYQDIVDSYQSQLRSACAAAEKCTFLGDQVQDMVIDASDLAPDTNHLSISGLHKMASVVWDAMGL